MPGSPMQADPSQAVAAQAHAQAMAQAQAQAQAAAAQQQSAQMAYAQPPQQQMPQHPPGAQQGFQRPELWIDTNHDPSAGSYQQWVDGPAAASPPGVYADPSGMAATSQLPLSPGPLPHQHAGYAQPAPTQYQYAPQAGTQWVDGPTSPPAQQPVRDMVFQWVDSPTHAHMQARHKAQHYVTPQASPYYQGLDSPAYGGLQQPLVDPSSPLSQPPGMGFRSPQTLDAIQAQFQAAQGMDAAMAAQYGQQPQMDLSGYYQSAMPPQVVSPAHAQAYAQARPPPPPHMPGGFGPDDPFQRDAASRTAQAQAAQAAAAQAAAYGHHQSPPFLPTYGAESVPPYLPTYGGPQSPEQAAAAAYAQQHAAPLQPYGQQVGSYQLFDQSQRAHGGVQPGGPYQQAQGRPQGAADGGASAGKVGQQNRGGQKQQQHQQGGGDDDSRGGRNRQGRQGDAGGRQGSSPNKSTSGGGPGSPAAAVPSGSVSDQAAAELAAAGVMEGIGREGLRGMLLSSLESLYTDRIRPMANYVKGRLKERSWPESIVKNFVELYAEHPDLFDVQRPAQPTTDEAIIFLISEPSWFKGWVDIDSPSDEYEESLWEAFAGFLDGEHTFAGGRYGMARELMQRNLPFLSELSLGEVCHVVQLAIQHRRLIVYHRKMLKPIQTVLSQSPGANVAASGGAAAAGATEGEEIQDMDDLCRVLFRMLLHHPQGLRLCRLKQMIKHEFSRKLSEMTFQCTKLIELFGTEPLSGTFVLDAENDGNSIYVRLGNAEMFSDHVKQIYAQASREDSEQAQQQK